MLVNVGKRIKEKQSIIDSYDLIYLIAHNTVEKCRNKGKKYKCVSSDRLNLNSDAAVSN